LIYQKIFTDEKPYHIGLGRLCEFPEHRHADFEINFCLSGEFDIIIDKENYRVTEGSTTLIPSMCAHAVPAQSGERSVITLIVGSSLLKKYFEDFSKLASKPKIYDLTTTEAAPLREIFLECADILNSKEGAWELLLVGNIYKIVATFLKLGTSAPAVEPEKNDYRKVENIEKALELIYYSYKEQITVEQAAELTGYSKSNFCKIFKMVVGESFHQALNRRRVNNAAGLLQASNMSVAEISAEVGFSEAKAFCRVFKSVYGISPGQYRKEHKI
jgi:AraC-like DNA-binding protein